MKPNHEGGMTVAELIARLQELPADLPVYISDWNEGNEPDYPLGDTEGPVVLPLRYVKRHGGVVRTLPERVVIGGKP